MSTLTSSYSLVEQAKRINPDGTQAQIVEVLNRKTGNILAEAPWTPSNDIWTHKTTRRGTLPAGSRRKLNQRITQSVSRTTEIMDVIEMIEDYSDVDVALANSMPSPAMFRAGEVDAFIEGLGQTVASDILYADANTDPDSMHGIAARMGTVDGRFVFDAGGSGAYLTSIYLVTWGLNTAHLIYPKNMASNMGVQHTDKGQVTSETSSGLIEVYRDHYVIRCGLSVRHPRAIGRYANIDTTSGSANTFDEDSLIALVNNMEIGPGSRIYVNDSVMTQMQIRVKDKNNVNYTASADALSGMPQMAFQGIPIRKMDREVLLNSETEIS